MHKYSLILFDLGDVVYRLDSRTFHELLEQYAGMTLQDFRQRFKQDHQYEAFERGQLDGDAYYRHFCMMLQIDLSYSQFIDIWNSIYREVFPETAWVLQQLHGRFTLAALTNTNPVHCHVWPERYKEILRYFDPIMISSEIGMRKPDREIFEYALQTTGAHAEETLFFDDNAENISAARQVGMTGVLVDHPGTIVATLRTCDLLEKEYDGRTDSTPRSSLRTDFR